VTYQFNEYQERWLKRLETTTEPQTYGHLEDCSGRCCLGVACDEFRADFDLGYVMGDDGTASFISQQTHTAFKGVLPYEIQEALKLRGPSGIFVASLANEEGQLFDLMSLNDYAH